MMAMLSVEDARKISLSISEPLEITYDNLKGFFHDVFDKSIEYDENPDRMTKPDSIVDIKKKINSEILDAEVKDALLRCLDQFYEKIFVEARRDTKDVPNPLAGRDDPGPEPEREAEPEPEPEPEEKPTGTPKGAGRTDPPKPKDPPKGTPKPSEGTSRTGSLRKYLKPMTRESIESYRGKSYESLNRELMLEYVLELYEVAKKDKSFVLPDMTQELLLSIYSNSETDKFTVLASIQKELYAALSANPKTQKEVSALQKDYQQRLVASSTLGSASRDDVADEGRAEETSAPPPRAVINIYDRFEEILLEDEQIQLDQIDTSLRSRDSSLEEVAETRKSLRKALTKDMGDAEFTRNMEIATEYNRLKEELDELQEKITSAATPTEKSRFQNEFAIKFRRFYDFANQRKPDGKKFREIATEFTGQLRALNLADEILEKKSKVLETFPYETDEDIRGFEIYRLQSGNLDKYVDLKEKREELREKLASARARGRRADVKALKNELKRVSGSLSRTVKKIKDYDGELEFDEDDKHVSRVLRLGILDRELSDREQKHIGFFMRKRVGKFDMKKIEQFERLYSGGFNYEQNRGLTYATKRDQLVSRMQEVIHPREEEMDR